MSRMEAMVLAAGRLDVMSPLNSPLLTRAEAICTQHAKKGEEKVTGYTL